MSFSFEWTVRTKDRAQEKLSAEYAPASVKSFIGDAIRDMPLAEGHLLHVKATGHICTGTDYSVSAANIVVEPFIVSE